MHLSLYIHDFHAQIGHAKAMQELINGLSTEQKREIKSIEVVAFTCSDLQALFPDFNCPLIFTRIPFPNLKPFLLKILFYHIVSFFHACLKGSKKIKIGVGVACLQVDIVNVQFIHEQWKPHFFSHRKLKPMAALYKKILFAYFALCEVIVYRMKKNVRYIIIAQFLADFLNKRFQTDPSNMKLIPSGVNLEEFNLSALSPADLKTSMMNRYPQLAKLDTDDPIALFVGAFERKGMEKAIRSVPAGTQFIVIGKSENPSYIFPDLPVKIFHIPFTKEVKLFYQLADMFIFPTQYEPFGLVIFEAYAMGLDLLIPAENTGASEFIPAGEGVTFFKASEILKVSELKKISYDLKCTRRAERLKQISSYSWENGAQKFYQLLTSVA